MIGFWVGGQSRIPLHRKPQPFINLLQYSLFLSTDGRTRTGTGFYSPTDFLTNYNFRCSFRICGLDFILTILQVPPVKSLHVPFWASLGIAILQVSPNLRGSTSKVSLRALKIVNAFLFLTLFSYNSCEFVNDN